MIEPKNILGQCELFDYAIDNDCEVMSYKAYNKTYFYDLSFTNREKIKDIWQRAITQIAIHGTDIVEADSRVYSLEVNLIKQGLSVAKSYFAMPRIVPIYGHDSLVEWSVPLEPQSPPIKD